MMDGCFSWLANICSLMPDPDGASMKRYRARVEGQHADDIHLLPAPENSLLMLGFISLRVPDEEQARLFYTDGLDFRRSPKEESWHEVRVNGGLSQFRLDFSDPGASAQRWPGIFRLWVKDVREHNELMRKFGGIRGSGGGIKEVMEAAAGEYKLKVEDVFNANVFYIEEAPVRMRGSLQSMTADPFGNKVSQDHCYICLSEFSHDDNPVPLACNHMFHESCIKDWLNRSRSCPVCKVRVDGSTAFTNVLAIIEVTFLVPMPGSAGSIARFYRQNLCAAAEVKPATAPGCQQCIVHLSPAEGLHQTLSFHEEPGAEVCLDPGTICLYARSHAFFREAFWKCKADDIVRKPATWAEAQRTGEFLIDTCIDPESKQRILSLPQWIRSPLHSECPVQVEDTSSPT
eukprot:TRINITY_DN42795_c0_g1_i1.p1 TRINITY_DN42795_c0_g1~~TRINITY_DN42795_c0_g1_i1.p1  ORF type:complete len:402 (-),score=47.95 TRINITY_DN42795_c0_g1_i1:5-1210(-)